MWEKSSDDLNQELMAQPNLDQYLTENEGYWRHADISVFSGRRRPSRDRLLCLCISMESSLEETQQLLKRVGYSPPFTPS